MRSTGFRGVSGALIGVSSISGEFEIVSEAFQEVQDVSRSTLRSQGLFRGSYEDL